MNPSNIRLSVFLLSSIILSSCSLFKVADEQYYSEISNDYSNGYSNKEFWDIVEKFWNRDIFEKVDGYWKLKKDKK